MILDLVWGLGLGNEIGDWGWRFQIWHWIWESNRILYSSNLSEEWCDLTLLSLGWKIIILLNIEYLTQIHEHRQPNLDISLAERKG